MFCKYCGASIADDATQAKESGQTSAQVADLLGHKDTRMVEKIYARTRHHSVMKQLEAIERLNE